LLSLFRRCPTYAKCGNRSGRRQGFRSAPPVGRPRGGDGRDSSSVSATRSLRSAPTGASPKLHTRFMTALARIPGPTRQSRGSQLPAPITSTNVVTAVRTETRLDDAHRCHRVVSARALVRTYPVGEHDRDIAVVREDQRGELRAGGMSHDQERLWVASVVGDRRGSASGDRSHDRYDQKSPRRLPRIPADTRSVRDGASPWGDK